MLEFNKGNLLYTLILIVSGYLLWNYDSWHSLMGRDTPKILRYDPNFRCKLFQLDKQAYLELPVQDPVKICDYVIQKVVTVEDEDHISLDFEDPNFKCCYTSLLTNESSWGELTLGDRCEKLSKNKTKVHHSFLNISCVGPRGIYSHLLSMVPSTFKNRTNVSDTGNMNVIVFLFDGISRRSFNAHLPLTRTELFKIKAVEFNKYTRVAEDVFENFMAVMSENTSFSCREKNIEINHQCYIWKKFEGKGYITAFLDDSYDSDYFDFEKKGFVNTPFDYYLKPFNLYMKKFKYHLSNKDEEGCVGNKLVFTNFLDYTKRYLQRTNTSGNKHFTIMHTSLVKNETTLSSLDKDFYEFFRFLTQKNLIQNTIIFILSNRGGGNRKVIRFESPEVNLPFMFVHLPEEFKDVFSVAHENLLGNSKLLTTAFDVRETLKMILMQNFNRTYDHGKALSLFSKIPIARSCMDAGIPQKFCSCSQIVMENMDGSQIYNIATVVLNHINTQLGIKYKECAKLRLDQIIKGSKVRVEKTTHDIKVKFSTKPGGGVFEAFILDEGYRYNVKNVSRMTAYKNESCVTDDDLEQFCYCPERKSEL